MMYVMVPDDRLDVLDADTIERIENVTESSIDIDDEAKTVKVINEDSIKEIDTKNVLNAISVGFSQTEALKLAYNEFYQLEVINLKDITRNKSELKRQKSRVIGEDGRTRELIEELTDTDVSIYNNKIGIIGETQDIIKARSSIMRLCEGSPHAKVYGELEKYKKNKNSSALKNFNNY